jgi:hypothetical protein
MANPIRSSWATRPSPPPLERSFTYPGDGPQALLHRERRSVRVLEVSFGEFAEDDIVHLEEAYERTEPRRF